MHLNAAQRRARKAADLAKFVRQYGRKVQKGGLDPNDRKYSADLERAIKHMDPLELGRLLLDDED